MRSHANTMPLLQGGDAEVQCLPPLGLRTSRASSSGVPAARGKACKPFARKSRCSHSNLVPHRLHASAAASRDACGCSRCGGPHANAAAAICRRPAKHLMHKPIHQFPQKRCAYRRVALLGGPDSVVGGLEDAICPPSQAVADVDREAAGPTAKQGSMGWLVTCHHACMRIAVQDETGWPP
jgi:hypothetical protein